VKLEDLKSLDPRDPGRWPLPVRIGAIAIWFVALTLVLLYVVVWQSKRPELAGYEAQEQTLRNQFRDKHGKAVNLALYKQQLAEIERSFGTMLRQLPGKTEVPNLLVDISQTGLAAGLRQQLFQPMPQQNKDFYAELPIKIRLTGSFHQFGEFVSGIATLPRIVTLHNVEIKPTTNDAYDQLTLDVTAKTYRYRDEEEIAAADEGRATAAPRGSSAR
jgi:type IV pilus assembly protein PilO